MTPELGVACALIVYLTYLLCQRDRGTSRCVPLKRNGNAIVDSRIVCSKAWNNLQSGLLNHAVLPLNTGLWLHGARRVHMDGMNFSIDVVLLDKDKRVLKLLESVPPGHPPIGGNQTRHVLELSSGAAKDFFGIVVGDQLSL